MYHKDMYDSLLYNRLKSYYLASGLGMELQYESTPTSEWSYSRGNCGGIFTSPNGLLTSPSYPHHYPDDSDCIYHISLPVGTNITIKILQLSMYREESSGQCYARDYLEIRDGSDDVAPVLALVCGYDPDLYPLIHSTQNHVWMR